MKPHLRVDRDTRRAFFGLLAASLVLHFVLTPFAGWISVLDQWLRRPAVVDNTPAEQLREIPIELFEQPTGEPAAADALPEDDPVALIEQLVEVPVQPAPAQPTSPAAKPKLAPPSEPQPSASEHPKPKPSPPKTASSEAVDAGAAASKPVVAQAADAGGKGRAVAQPAKPSAIDSPVALAGQGAKLVEKQTHVGLILYMDRVRSHPVGQRIAALLPKLPQWRDFFGDGAVSPVRDFDRMFLLGPSFANSSGLVMAIAYNTSTEKMRATVNELVKQRGQWLKDAPVPAALTYADRAERLVFFPAPKLVMVVPPHLKEQAFHDKFTGIPEAKGQEALVAFTANPHKALSRLGLDVPESLQSAKLRITPLDDGRVRLELDAEDESEQSAKDNAARLTQSINATLELVSGVSDLLGRFGFGGLSGGASLPRVRLVADGKWVRGQQVLTEAQVAFVLDRVERQLLRAAPRPLAPSSVALPASRPVPHAVPKPNRPSVPPSASTPAATSAGGRH